MQNTQTKLHEEQLALRTEYLEQEAQEALEPVNDPPARWPSRIHRTPLRRRYAA